MPKHIIENEQSGGDLTNPIQNMSVAKLAGKIVNDSAIGDGKVLVYRSISDSIVYENPPSTTPSTFPHQTVSAASATTTSTIYVNAATITVSVAGSYLCIYADNISNSIAGADMRYALRVDRNDGGGIITIAESERKVDWDGQLANYMFPITTQAFITNLKANDVIYASVLTSTGTLTVYNRVLSIIKLM